MTVISIASIIGYDLAAAILPLAGLLCVVVLLLILRWALSGGYDD